MFFQPKRLFAAAAVHLVVCVSHIALASAPSGVIAAVDSVQFEPDASKPKRMLISGVFALWKNPPSVMDYDWPHFGQMYFECPAGKENLCQLEWKDIASAAGTHNCVVFGDDSGKNGAVWPHGSQPTQPDPYKFNFGVQVTPHALGFCQKLKSASSGDAGVGADAAPDSHVATVDSGKATADAASQQSDAFQEQSDAGPHSLADAQLSPSPANDAAAKPIQSAGPASDRGGCAVVARANAPRRGTIELLWLLAVALAFGTARRKTRRSGLADRDT